MKPLRIVIIEDEAVTARNLAHVLQHSEFDISVTVMLDSVSASVAWFADAGEDHDLIFMDIRLADGLSFDIFKQVSITKPVIFVTAYNDHALQAFKNNGIDYILKPFDEQEIGRAIKKYKAFSTSDQQAPGTIPVELLLQQLRQLNTSYKKSFLVHFRDKLIPLEAARIAWLYTANELVYAHTSDGRQFIMEFTMEQLEQQLDPQLFFRANRQFIINRNTINEVDFYFNGRLSVKVNPQPTEAIIVSKARVPEFKAWMNT